MRLALRNNNPFKIIASSLNRPGQKIDTIFSNWLNYSILIKIKKIAVRTSSIIAGSSIGLFKSLKYASCKSESKLSKKVFCFLTIEISKI